MSDPTVESVQSWHVRGRTVRIARPLVIGILNVTPDSFSDGGRFVESEPALTHVRRMVAEGADGVDVGGESTRPQGATPVSAAAEERRVVPILRAIRSEFPDLLVSVDTTKAEVAAAAVNAGADVINDVSALRIDPRIGDIAAATGAGVVLMHSRGTVSDMGTYRYAEYGDDVLGAILGELQDSLASAHAAGIRHDAIVLDPGIGFAKRSAHSLRVLAGLDRIAALGYPIMVGVSRKRFIGELSAVSVASERVAGTVGANVIALARGARIFRVHDVAPNREALNVAWGILMAGTRSDSSAQAGAARDSRFPIPDSQ